ncbi:MAG: hypothetical protein PWP67_552 [Clostridium butyricum]|nr:hypothetical protein [Clostridium butyricum]
MKPAVIKLVSLAFLFVHQNCIEDNLFQYTNLSKYIYVMTINEFTIHFSNQPLLITLSKNSLHLSLFGLVNISSGDPSSKIYPLSINITLSATSFAKFIS